MGSAPYRALRSQSQRLQGKSSGDITSLRAHCPLAWPILAIQPFAATNTSIRRVTPTLDSLLRARESQMVAASRPRRQVRPGARPWESTLSSGESIQCRTIHSGLSSSRLSVLTRVERMFVSRSTGLPDATGRAPVPSGRTGESISSANARMIVGGIIAGGGSTLGMVESPLCECKHRRDLGPTFWGWVLYVHCSHDAPPLPALASIFG
jgi:hypothetical protein